MLLGRRDGLALGRRGRLAGLARGYDADEVDEWLDGVVRSLDAYERGAGTTAEVSSRDAEAVRFAMTWGSSSYPTDEVDAMLQAVFRALRAHESSAADRA